MTFRGIALLLPLLLPAAACAADFVEHFDGRDMALDPEARSGWAYRTGDGDATMTFAQADGTGRIEVDARADRRNVWWAYIRRSVSGDIDGAELARPDRELRAEARIRTSVAPRRVNLHFNHSRTTDFHSHLREYDIPTAGEWHVVSLTTDGFDARADDEVFVQMALMDWGLDRYTVEIDYLTVSVVDPARAGPDLGDPLPYRPPVPPLERYVHRVPVAEDAIVDSARPGVNFASWRHAHDADARPLIAAGGTQTALLRWDLDDYEGRVPRGWGALELTTEAVQRAAATGLEAFGELRVVEILGGDPDWIRDSVSFDSFLAGEDVTGVLNGQTMVDARPAAGRGGTTLIPVSPPVLGRLLSGRTKGLAVYGLGAIRASFRSGASAGDGAPTLYFNLQ